MYIYKLYNIFRCMCISLRRKSCIKDDPYWESEEITASLISKAIRWVSASSLPLFSRLINQWKLTRRCWLSIPSVCVCLFKRRSKDTPTVFPGVVSRTSEDECCSRKWVCFGRCNKSRLTRLDIGKAWKGLVFLFPLRTFSSRTSKLVSLKIKRRLHFYSTTEAAFCAIKCLFFLLPWSSWSLPNFPLTVCFLFFFLFYSCIVFTLFGFRKQRILIDQTIFCIVYCASGKYIFCWLFVKVSSSKRLAASPSPILTLLSSCAIDGHQIDSTFEGSKGGTSSCSRDVQYVHYLDQWRIAGWHIYGVSTPSWYEFFFFSILISTCFSFFPFSLVDYTLDDHWFSTKPGRQGWTKHSPARLSRPNPLSFALVGARLSNVSCSVCLSSVCDRRRRCTAEHSDWPFVGNARLVLETQVGVVSVSFGQLLLTRVCVSSSFRKKQYQGAPPSPVVASFPGMSPKCWSNVPWQTAIQLVWIFYQIMWILFQSRNVCCVCLSVFLPACRRCCRAGPRARDRERERKK